MTLAGVLALVSTILIVQNAGLRRRAEFGMGSKPLVDRFFRQLFANNLRTFVVMADGNLVVLENEAHQQISIQDYQTHQFSNIANARIPDAATRYAVLTELGRRYTGVSDAKVAAAMALTFASNEIQADVVFARNLRAEQASSQNTVLLGSQRSNPWVSLFESELNFQTEFTESPRGIRLVNRAPLDGEQRFYRADWGRLGYCRVAYLSNPKGAGSTLLISGTDVQVTEAGGEFITGERWIQRLRERLQVRPGAAMPHFEALLEVRVVDGAIEKIGLLACRRH